MEHNFRSQTRTGLTFDELPPLSNGIRGSTTGFIQAHTPTHDLQTRDVIPDTTEVGHNNVYRPGATHKRFIS